MTNKWIQSHPEEWKKYYKLWVKNHYKQHLANVKRWTKDNPESRKRSRKKYWDKISDERKLEYANKNKEYQKYKYTTDAVFREKVKIANRQRYQKNKEKT